MLSFFFVKLREFVFLFVLPEEFFKNYDRGNYLLKRPQYEKKTLENNYEIQFYLENVWG